MSDEFARIARLTRLLQSTAPQIELGIGDDAAILRRPEGRVVLSVDASVENVHFRREFAALDVIGARAFSAAVSDLAAMGAQPTAALTAVCLRASTSDEELMALMTGVAAAAQRYACPVVGGNLSQASELSITTTVVGELCGRALTRSGARAGDGIYVTGTLGAAGLGLLLLQRGQAQREPRFVERWRNPTAQLALGQRLLQLATAAIDVSDGALQDLEHLCDASGVGAVLDAPAIPLLPGFAELARSVGRDPIELALCGGEDYELLFTASDHALAQTLGTRIGVATRQAGELRVRDAHGQAIELQHRGYRHFEG
ncbi:MAG TPA: thiamine-phosphate kinase [Polyangiales bacterium]